MYQNHKLEGRAYLQQIIYGGLLYVQKENTQIAKLTPEIEKTIHERRRSKELIKHYLTSLAIKEIVLLRRQKHRQ